MQQVNLKPLTKKPQMPSNSFSQYMQEKMKENPDIKKVYDGESSQQSQQPTLNKIASKPFQIKSSIPSASNKKPINQFYQSANIKRVDTSIPRPSSECKASGKEKNPSFVSTEKSYEQSGDYDTRSVKSETLSISQSSKTQQIDKKSQSLANWVYNDPQKKVLKRQPKELQDMLDKVDKCIKETEESRSRYQKELSEYLDSYPEQQQKYKKLDENAELERQIESLQQQLQEVEREQIEKKVFMNLEKLKQIVEQPIENDSQLSVKQRSMFITELLRNRQQLQFQLQGTQSNLSQQDANNTQDMQDKEDVVKKLGKQFNKGMKFMEKIEPSILLQEDQDRLDKLLENIENYKPVNIKQLPNPYKLDETQLTDIHKKLKKINPNYKEQDSLELDRPGVLPKDPSLRKEAMERIIEQKTFHVNEELKKIANRPQLEEKSKMIQTIENLKKKTKYQPSPYLISQLQFIDQVFSMNKEAEQIIKDLSKQDILKETRELKEMLDNAIKLGNDILKNSSSNSEENLNVIQNQKKQVNQLEEEIENLYKFALNIFDTLPKIQEEENENEEQNQQNLEINIDLPKYVEKTNEELDFEITQKLKIEHPELFDD